MKTKSTLPVLLVAVLVLVLGVSTALAQDAGNAAEESQRLFLPMIGSGEEETMLAAGNGTVTVDLLKGDNTTRLAGGIVEYYKSGGWQVLGTTDGVNPVQGVVDLTGNTTDFRIRWFGGTKEWSGVNVTTNPVLTANTTPVTVKLETCTGAPLAGAAYWNAGSAWGGYNLIGLTPASTELLPGSYTFRINYSAHNDANSNFNNTKNQDIGVDPVVIFNTTKVTLYGSNITYYENAPTSGWVPFVNPSEMLPGTIKDFKFNGGATKTLTIAGCNFTGGMLTLVNEATNPLANYPVDFPTEQRNLKWKYRCGGSWGPETSFQTDGVGQTSYNIDCSSVGDGTGSWDNKITVTLNQTSLEQDVGVNSTFQAAKVDVNLQTCSGPITDSPGGTVEQGGGYWYTHGTTGPSGTVSFYTFPGDIKVKMTYNHNNEERAGVAIAPGANEVDFVTTKLTINHAGDARSNKGGSWWMFSKPSMDLLPGDYPFQLKTGSTWSAPVSTTIPVIGCEMVYPTPSTDTTPPTTAPTQDPPANSEGWNQSDVTVTWNWADEAGGSGIDPDNCTKSSTSSGEGNPLTLTATCKDLAGNEGNASYPVKVDKTLPTLAPVVSPNPVPLNSAATATSGAADALSGIASKSCEPVDTSTPGAQTVTCTATDNAGNSASATAAYFVSLQASKLSVIDFLSAMLTGDKKTDDKISKAIDHINKSLKPEYWLDDNHLTKKGKKVFDEEKKAVHDLMKVDPAPQAAIDALVAIDASLAQTAINEATAACPTLAAPKDLAKCQEEVIKANKEMAKAQEELAKGDYDKAIDKYKKAWEHSQHAMKKVVEEVPEE